MKPSQKPNVQEKRIKDRALRMQENDFFVHERSEVQSSTNLQSNRVVFIPTTDEWNKKSKNFVEVVLEVSEKIHEANTEKNSKPTTHNLLKREVKYVIARTKVLKWQRKKLRENNLHRKDRRNQRQQ